MGATELAKAIREEVARSDKESELIEDQEHGEYMTLDKASKQSPYRENKEAWEALCANAPRVVSDLDKLQRIWVPRYTLVRKRAVESVTKREQSISTETVCRPKSKAKPRPSTKASVEPAAPSKYSPAWQKKIDRRLVGLQTLAASLAENVLLATSPLAEEYVTKHSVNVANAVAKSLEDYISEVKAHLEDDAPADEAFVQKKLADVGETEKEAKTSIKQLASDTHLGASFQPTCSMPTKFSKRHVPCRPNFSSDMFHADQNFQPTCSMPTKFSTDMPHADQIFQPTCSMSTESFQGPCPKSVSQSPCSMSVSKPLESHAFRVVVSKPLFHVGSTRLSTAPIENSQQRP
jgi:hypothetical protein